MHALFVGSELDAEANLDRMLIEVSVDGAGAEVEGFTTEVGVSIFDASEDVVRKGVVEASADGVAAKGFAAFAEARYRCFATRCGPAASCVNQGAVEATLVQSLP